MYYFAKLIKCKKIIMETHVENYIYITFTHLVITLSLWLILNNFDIVKNYIFIILEFNYMSVILVLNIVGLFILLKKLHFKINFSICYN